LKIYKIAQVAQKLGISKQTLVRYEKKGILPKSPRNHINSWRQYSEEDILRMKEILRKGFTLIELVMVMVIMAILTAWTIPRFESLYSIKLSGAMKKVVSDVRYVQQIAISRHTNTRMIFNKTTDVYVAEEEVPSGSNTWVSIKSPFTRGNLTVNYATDPQYKGINITDVNFNSTNTLQFKWLGEPVSGGRVDFEYKQNTNSIFVQNTTGIVRAQ
jgi:prepilin-type N-terminal cleavage/methylation domain-containing protein